MVTIRTPFCGYNTPQYVQFNVEDLSCYSNKIESLSLIKRPYDHWHTNKACLSAITVTDISKSFTRKMAAKINWHRCETKLRHCHLMYSRYVCGRPWDRRRPGVGRALAERRWGQRARWHRSHTVCGSHLVPAPSPGRTLRLLRASAADVAAAAAAAAAQTTQRTSSSSFDLPDNTTVCTSTSIQLRRAGQQGPTKTLGLTAALTS